MTSLCTDLRQTLLWLCEVPSPTGGEARLCSALRERLRALPAVVELARYGDSLVARLRAAGRGPRVVLAGHLDVVQARHEGPPRIEGDRVYGPGASDMKSGLALMLDLAERWEACGVDLSLVFYAREEGPFAENELGDVLARHAALCRADLAICLEPSDNRLQLGCAGSVHGTVRFLGKSAHSARPWQGDNAIHKAGPFLGRLAQLTPRPTVTDGLEWLTVTSATLAHGGRARNVIPDLFEINVNHRFGPGQTMAAAKQYLAELVGTEGALSIVEEAPPAPPCRRHPLVEALAASGVCGVEPKQAWTDVCRFAQVGVAAVNFGPGLNAQAHQDNEWTSAELLEQGQGILARWIRTIAS